MMCRVRPRMELWICGYQPCLLALGKRQIKTVLKRMREFKSPIDSTRQDLLVRHERQNSPLNRSQPQPAGGSGFVVCNLAEPRLAADRRRNFDPNESRRSELRHRRQQRLRRLRAWFRKEP